MGQLWVRRPGRELLRQTVVLSVVGEHLATWHHGGLRVVEGGILDRGQALEDGRALGLQLALLLRLELPPDDLLGPQAVEAVDAVSVLG